MVSCAAYEIWFKQILYEIDSVRELFLGKANMDRILDNIAKTLSDTMTIESEDAVPRRRKRDDMCSISEDAVHHHEVDDAHMLEINKRLNRVVMIMKVAKVRFWAGGGAIKFWKGCLQTGDTIALCRIHKGQASPS
jgi:hypothetical protein